MDAVSKKIEIWSATFLPGLRHSSKLFSSGVYLMSSGGFRTFISKDACACASIQMVLFQVVLGNMIEIWTLT